MTIEPIIKLQFSKIAKNFTELKFAEVISYPCPVN